MNRRLRHISALTALFAIGLVGPWLMPAYISQFAQLWLFIVLALSWDIMGGQTGYNSFGNIIYFGIGMYASAVAQVGVVWPVADYTAAKGGGTEFVFTAEQIYTGLALGIPLGGLLAMAAAIVFGALLLGMRGHYFAIATLGLAVAIAELAAGWDYIGAGSGMVTPTLPQEIEGPVLFYYLSLALAVLAILFYAWLYSTRFRLAINAIRDDEDKAEALGHHTTRNKMTAWAISALFTGMAGAIYGNLSGFIDPHDIAFNAEIGVWMILMAILGGKGTLWGPIIGAIVFFVSKELFWTYLLGWQRVALGLLIVIIVVFFPEGIMGWVRSRWPHLFAAPHLDGDEGNAAAAATDERKEAANA